jgi:hypothetical protein
VPPGNDPKSLGCDGLELLIEGSVNGLLTLGVDGFEKQLD